MPVKPNPTLAEIIDALLVITKSGRLAWEATADSDTFQAAFPRYSVTISQDAIGSNELRVFDTTGRFIEDTESLRGSSFPVREKLSELYDLARRTALGIDAALDDFLGVLKEEVAPTKPKTAPAK